MKKLVLSAALVAALAAFAAPATAAPADNGPPAAFVATEELALQATNESYDCMQQYTIAVNEDPNGLVVTAVGDAGSMASIEQTALSATRGAPEVAVPTDTFEVGGGISEARSANYNMIGDHVWNGHSALWHNPGDRSVGALRAQSS